MESFIRTMQEHIFYKFSDQSTLLLAAVTSFVLIAYNLLRDKDAPPGPMGLPIIGYWPFLKNEICSFQLLNLKEKYGDVFSFRVTGQLYINLASFKVLREAHITKSDCFSERTNNYNLLGRIFKDGVVFSNGEKWQTIRKFFLHQFRERGMSTFRENTAEAMYDTTKSLIDELRSNSGKPVEILRMLEENGNRVIRQTLLGVNTSITDNEIQKMQSEYKTVLSLIDSSTMILMGNIAKYFVLPFLPNYKKAMQALTNVRNRFQEIIKEHENTFDEDNIRDIIDSYINERNIRKSKGDHTAQYFSDTTLAANLLQFVGDGSSSSAVFITTFLKALLDHPEEQEKIYKELVEVCGEDRNPGLEDKSKLTYTNAFLLEGLRCNNFLPIFPSLLCTKETTIGGYRIPKGAVTATNAYAIHNDPRIYENPEEFNPSRFISESGKPKPELPIMFGVGKRVCLGESFIMTQAFLTCTAIVKHFKISYHQSKSYYELVRNRTLEIIVIPRK